MDAHAWDERYAAAAQVWSTAPNQFVESALISTTLATAIAHLFLSLVLGSAAPPTVCGSPVSPSAPSADLRR